MGDLRQIVIAVCVSISALVAGCGGGNTNGDGAGGVGASSGQVGTAGAIGIVGGGAPSVGGITGATGGTSAGGAMAPGGGAGETAIGSSDAGGGTSGSAGQSGAAGGSGGTGTSGSGGSGGTTTAVVGPCDIYQSTGTPCVAAHSTVRALYGAFSGSLYQVRRNSDNTTKDIPVGSRGLADSGVQDAFCSGTTCIITLLYDQSGKGNRLEYQGAGSSVGGMDSAAIATSEALTVQGKKVYSLYINPHNSYWRDGHLTGVPTGSAAEALYMVTSGTHVNSGCCFDYGNSETNRQGGGNGAMDAISFGTECWFGGCSGTGPWVQADIEDGLFPGGSKSWNPNQKSFTSKYVTAMLKNNGTSRMALKGANAQSGDLVTLYDGALPPGGYSPMRKQGAIVLGSGGDCCATNRNDSAGTFYEGVIVSGYPSEATDTAVQANIVAAGYGGP